MNADTAENREDEEAGRREDDPLGRLFARWQQELLGTLYYLVGNLEDARDALQETYVKCWRGRESLGGVADLKAWVFRVALNTGKDMRRNAWRRRRQTLAEETVVFSSEASPESVAMRREQLETLRRAILALRPEEKEVFLLRQNGTLTYDEIAAALQTPVGTVKTRMRSALQNLRDTVNRSEDQTP